MKKWIDLPFENYSPILKVRDNRPIDTEFTILALYDWPILKLKLDYSISTINRDTKRVEPIYFKNIIKIFDV